MHEIFDQDPTSFYFFHFNVGFPSILTFQIIAFQFLKRIKTILIENYSVKEETAPIDNLRWHFFLKFFEIFGKTRTNYTLTNSLKSTDIEGPNFKLSIVTFAIN